MKTCPLCEMTYPSQHTTCPTDGALLIDSRELEPGTVIRGKYRIVRQLGRGGMGTVYLAEHILLGRPRALKFISSELSQDATFLRRFRREAQAAIELRHPNVVEVVDLDQAEDGSPYIAMEYVEGPDLRHALDSGAFPVERALHIARGIALGLGAAHAKGIIHRDVKPENILLAVGEGKPETPKLLDFGIAAMKETATAVSRTHGLMLTPPYAAPEQWKGMAAEELDGRTDLYALGGVFYEMLTGDTPFHAHNTEGWMYQHLHEQPQPPSQLRPDLANWQDLDALVLRLLAKEREQRPRDVAELVGLIDAVAYVAPKTRHETVGEATVFEHGRRSTVVEPPPLYTPIPSPQFTPQPVPTGANSRILKWAVVTILIAGLGIWAAVRFLPYKAPIRQVDMARVDNAIAMPDAAKEDAIVVTVRRDGEVWLGQNKTSIDVLGVQLRDRAADKPDHTMYLRADARAQFRAVEDVIDSMRTTGVDDVGLLVGKRGETSQKEYFACSKPPEMPRGLDVLTPQPPKYPPDPRETREMMNNQLTAPTRIPHDIQMVPKSSTEAAMPSRNESRTIVVQILYRLGSAPFYKINETDVAKAELLPRLIEIYANRAERVLFIKGDDNIDFRYVAEAIDIARSANVDHIGVMTPRILAGQ